MFFFTSVEVAIYHTFIFSYKLFVRLVMVLLTCPLLHFGFCSQGNTVPCDLWKDVLNNDEKITRGKLQNVGDLLRTQMRLVAVHCTCCRFLIAPRGLAIKTKLIYSFPYPCHPSFIETEQQLLTHSKLK